MCKEGKKTDLTYAIIGSAMEVHKMMGPGLLESVYEECLSEEFTYQGIKFERQKLISLNYRGKTLEKELRVDFLVEKEVILEIKSVEEILKIHEFQLLTYLKLTKKDVGLLINFNTNSLKEGIRRRVM